MLFATWRPTSCHPGISIAFAAHLHGRDLLVERPAVPDATTPPSGCSTAPHDATPVARSGVCGATIPSGLETSRWHWQVTAPCGRVLAEGDAPDRRTAEEAAEDEVEAIHPPSDALIDVLLR